MTLQQAYDLLKEERDLPEGKTGILVMDIDDTLVKANPNVIKCYKSVNGKEQPLTTAQFATDPDKAKMGKNVKMYNMPEDAPSEGIAFSIREFRDPTKVYNSIVKGTPIVTNLRIMDDKLKHGWDIAFLTARGLQGVVTQALTDFLKTKDKNNKLVPIGEQFKKALSAAVNDEDIKYAGRDDGEKKANVLRKIALKYDKVVFIDDDLRNTSSVKNAGIKTKSGERVKTILASKLATTNID